MRFAAAALALGMVTPLACTALPDSPFGSVAYADEPTANPSKAIHSPGKADQEGTISGSVKEIVEATVPFENVQKSGKALEGVKVYAQWYEGENTQHSSPVYYTESDANGNFTINMAPYTDAQGVNREFRADASVGNLNENADWSRDENREKIRVWTELPEDMTDKYRLVHQPAAGIFPLTTTTPTTQGDGRWGNGKITGMTIQYAQKDKLPQHLPENKWGESTGTNNSGAYKGQAFWNLDVLQGATNHNQASAFDPKDIPAPGLKVVGSYLTDEAVTKIEEYAKDNFGSKELRGKGWTPTDEAGLQKWINEQVAEDPEGWIAETLTTTTGADGKFQLLWKGIYGNNHTGTGGGINPPADKLHKLAGSHDEGSWLNGNRESKHVNMDWSYVSVLDKDGNPLPDNIGTLYPWALGNWAGPTSGGAHAELFGGDLSYIEPTADVYTGWNIALAPQALKFDVVDKNTTDNWANIGDKVQTDTAGLPISDNLNYYIEWVDKDGKVVKTCETAKADTATKIPSCELEVPADAQAGDTFTARLKVADEDPDPKNDLVLAMDAFAVTRDYLEYEPVNAKVEEAATSEPKFDNPETEPEEAKPEKAKFELGKLPEGVTKGQVKVDPKTGVVTFTPNADQADKTFKFPVVMRNEDEDLQVPVLDENGDPVKDESGNPKTQGRIVARGEAVFNVVKDDDGDGVAPDPDGNNDGEPDDPNAPEVDAQGVTFGVKIDGKIVESDGNNDTAEELPESVRDVVVTLKAEDGTEYKSNDNGETWRGAKDYPVVQNFGLKDLPKGKYTVSVAGVDDINKNDLKLKADSQLRDDAEIQITGNTPNLFVELETVDSKNYEPGYEDGSGKPGEDVTVPAPEFKDKDGNPTEAPEDTTFKPGDNAPDGVTVDPNTGEITVPVPGDANPGDKITVPVEVTYPDGSTDTVDVTVTVDEPDTPAPAEENKDQFEPEYKSELVVPGEETKSSPTFTDKDGKDAKAPEGSKFKITDGFTAPEGYVVEIDEKTGEITVTFPDESKLNKDTKEEFDVPVTVTYPDGSTDKTDANFKLDTDNDGKPDTEDEDDDGDGIPDEDEKDKGSNPKDEGSIPATPLEPGNPTNAATFEPEYESELVVPGEETKSSPSFTDKDGKDAKAPEDSKFKITDGFTAPEGYVVEIDESTGEITVTFPDKSKLNKDTVEEFDVPVTVTYPDETTDEVEANFKLDTDNDGKPDTTDGDDDGDGIPDEDEKDKGSNPKDEGSIPATPLEPGNPTNAATFEPEYESELVVPGEETKSSPSFTDKDGKDAKAPEDSKFKITDGFTAPEGYVVEIDEKTGEITVTFPDESKLNKDTVEEFDVPVTVTYPDETTDEVKANFKLDTDNDGKPDTTDGDDDGDGIPDEDEKDKGSNPKDEGSIPATPLEPGNPTNAATFEPEYESELVVPGEETKSSPSFTDKDGKDAKAPEDSKFKITDGFTAPEGYVVEIDEKTGEITVTFPDESKLNKDTVEEFDVPVTVTYPDETTDEVKANFKLDTDNDGKPDTTDGDDDGDGIPDEDEKDKGSNPKDEGSIPATPLEPGNPTNAATFEPEYEDGSGKPGDDVKVPAPEFKDKDGNSTDAPEDTTFKPGENAPEGVTVDENTGEITVPVPEDAKPGDKITVPVEVTYPDGSKDTVEVTVTVDEPDAPAEQPDWNDDKGNPGDKVEVPNTGGPVEDGTTVETEGPGKAEIDDNGNLVVDIDKDAKPGDKLVVIVKDKDGNEIDRVTVTVDKPAEEPAPEGNGNVPAKPGDNTGAPRGKQPVKVVPLPRTGAEVAGVATAAAALIAAGLGLVFSRRRRAGEEN